MSLPILGKMLYVAVFYNDIVIKITGGSFFPKKKRLRQCITHTQGIQIPGTSFFLKKKRLRQCITHTQGIKIPGTSFFQKKKRLRQCITHTQGIFSGFCMILHVFYVIEYEKILKIV
jgi:hypothetical protein